MDALRAVLSTEAAWHICTALRGPDFEEMDGTLPGSKGWPLKATTTCVLRYFVTGTKERTAGGYAVIPPLEAKAAWTLFTAAVKRRVAEGFRNNHFSWHFITAMNELGPEAVEYKTWLLSEFEAALR